MSETKVVTVNVWICHAPDCGDYFGSPSTGDLPNAWSGPKAEDKSVLQQKTGSPYKHNRAECPSCRARGKHVQRVLHAVEVVVPVEDLPSPPLPSSLVGTA